MGVEPKKIKNVNMEVIMGRVRDMVEQRERFIATGEVNDLHIKLQQGNSKTGRSCWTVSLIPIADCPNCSGCKYQCYDIINVCFQPRVKTDRAKNSAIHKVDITRFWDEISLGIRYNCVSELRLNVGGDLILEDFYHIDRIARENPRCDILFFTKTYDAINQFLDEHEFPPNVHAILSAWENMEMDNRHNLPTSHVLFADGRTTAPEFGAIFCAGNCSQCHYNSEGCFALPKGGAVIFPAH